MQEQLPKARSCMSIVVMVVIVAVPVAVCFAVRYLVLIMPVHSLLEILRAVRVVMRVTDHPLVQQGITLVKARR